MTRATRWLSSGLLAALAATSFACASNPANVALVIGNGDYAHAAPLPNPTRDAEAIGRSLRSVGWSVTTATDLDRSALEEAVEAFGLRTDRAKQAIFFYAGHGLQIDGVNYIVPRDFEPTVAGLDRLLPLDTVLDRLTRSDAQLVVVLDACRDNPFSEALGREFASGERGLAVPHKQRPETAAEAAAPDPAPGSRVVGRGLAEIDVRSGTLIAYATQPGNVALDGAGEHSPFTEGLLEHLTVLGKDVSWVLRRTRGSVIDKTDGEQVPWDHSSLVKPFVVHRKRAAAPPP